MKFENKPQKTLKSTAERPKAATWHITVLKPRVRPGGGSVRGPCGPIR